MKQRISKYWHIFQGIAISLYMIAFHYNEELKRGEPHADIIIVTVGMLIMGTLCFLILPIIFIIVTFAVRFLSVAALPIVLFMVFCNWLGDTHIVTSKTFLVGALLSSYGIINIITAQLAKSETFNPYLYFKGI